MTPSRTLLVILLLLVISCTTGKAQAPSLPNAFTDPLMKELKQVMQNEHLPGLMISIVKKDSLFFSAGLGYADVAQQLKVDAHTQFHLASITKFFVALAIQKLIAAGKLHLNDRLRVLAPEVPYTNPWESTHPLRLVHLLEHTAGFEDIELSKMVHTSGLPLEGIEAVKSVEHSLHARWKPGQMMSYSNPGYMVLGYLLEKVSGMPWNHYIDQVILQPLKMDHTLFDRDGKKLPLYAIGYNFDTQAFTALPLYGPSGNGAAGSLVSTATDMTKFMRSLLKVQADSAAELLRERDQLELESIHSTLASQNGLHTGYALGNELFPNNKKVTFRGHNGKGEGFSSWLFFNREAGLAYAISTNCNANLWPVSQVIEGFLTKYIQAPTLSALPIDASTVEPLLGYYQFMNPKNEKWEFHKRIFSGIRLVSIHQDKLIIDAGNGPIDSLIHVGKGLFRFKGDIVPSAVIGQDEEGRAFFQGYGNRFYRKTTYASILIQKIPIYLGLIAAFLSLLYTLIGITLLLTKKINPRQLSLPLFPAVGIVCFGLSYRLLGTTDEIHKELFTFLNTTSFSIFAGMLLFGISVIVGAYGLYKQWSKLTKTWIKFALLFNSIFLFYLVVLLTIHGWIGVPIWL